MFTHKKRPFTKFFNKIIVILENNISFELLNKQPYKMNTTKIEQIQNEILELTMKINALQHNLQEIKNEQSQETAIDFQTMMDWADEYFVEKENIWELSNDLENGIDIDDVCNVDLSLSGNEIEVEKEWINTKEIVERVMNAVHKDFKNWMKLELENHVGSDNN